MSPTAVYNKLLSFLKGQAGNSDISVYQIADGRIDDFNDTEGLQSLGPFSLNITEHSGSSIISGIATQLPSSSCLTALFHFNGVHGETTTQDNGPFNIDYGITNLLIDTSSKQFGVSSAYFNGSSLIEGIYDLAFNISQNENFTIEYNLNLLPNSGGYRALTSHHSTNDPDSTGYAMYVNPSDKMTFEINYGYISLIGSTVVADGDWHHVAVVRSGSDENNLKIYLDGEVDMQTTYHDAIECSDTSFKLGASRFYSDYYTGYVDELRIVRNWPVYSSSFTPPSSAHGNQTFRNMTPPSGSLVSKFESVSPSPPTTSMVLIGNVLSGSINNFLLEITKNSGSTWTPVTMSKNFKWKGKLLDSVDPTFSSDIYFGQLLQEGGGQNIGYRMTTASGSLMFDILGIGMYSE